MAKAVHPTIVRNAISGAFRESYDARPVVRTDLAMQTPSNASQEEYGWLAGVRGMKEWIDERKRVNLPDRSFILRNRHWEDNIDVDLDDLEDDQTGQYKSRAREMGINAADHPDTLLFALLRYGGTAGYTSYDGKVFFANDHVEGEQTNDNTATLEVAAANTTEPTSQELHNALENGILALQKMRNWAGDPFVNNLQKLAVIVPPSLSIRAAKALNTSIIPAQATDGTNVTGGVIDNIWRGRDIRLIADARVYEDSTSTNTRYFYVAEISREVRPFIYQVRRGITEKVDTSREFSHNKMTWGVDARYNVGYGAYWLIVRVALTT